jgi:hypothetical protein
MRWTPPEEARDRTRKYLGFRVACEKRTLHVFVKRTQIRLRLMIDDLATIDL